MDRRTFISLAAIPFINKIVPSPKFNPTPAQLEFYGGAAGGGKTLTLYGIPFIEHDGTYRNTYMGINRDNWR